MPGCCFAGSRINRENSTTRKRAVFNVALPWQSKHYNGGETVGVQQVINSAKALNAKEIAMVAHSLIASQETRQDEGVD